MELKGLTLTFTLKKGILEVSSDQQKSHRISWNNADIQDFIRRLGFANLDERSMEKVKKFAKLNEVYRQCICNTLLSMKYTI